MSNELDFTTNPFDAIMLPGERWSARDLMPLLGYSRWENFETPINRAMATARNQNHDVERLFLRSQENSGGRPRTNYQLSRFAAYLVAMNGDPNMPEVAAAQAYFAIKTREAEVAQPAPALTGAELLAHAVIEAQKMLTAATERIAELEPKAEVADKLLDAEGDLSVRDAAQSLTRAGVKVGQNRLFGDLERRGWIARARGDGRYRVLQAAIEGRWMSVLPQSHYHPRTGVLVVDAPQPRITPKGLQKLLHEYGADQ